MDQPEASKKKQIGVHRLNPMEVLLLFQKSPKQFPFSSKAWTCLFDAWRKINHIPQMVLENGNESHGRIRKKSPTEQIQVDIQVKIPPMVRINKSVGFSGTPWAHTIRKPLPESLQNGNRMGFLLP